jgi:hypothetical protein
MKRFGMKSLALIAAASTIALGAYAQTGQTPSPVPAPAAPPAATSPMGPSTSMPHDGSRMERTERRGARMEERMNRRLERLKTELKLSPQQEALWSPVQAQLRKMQDERRSFRQGEGMNQRYAELPARLDVMAERAQRGSQDLRDLSAAIKPLWASLDDGQKATVLKNLPGRWHRGERGDHGGRGERGNRG